MVTAFAVHFMTLQVFSRHCHAAQRTGHRRARGARPDDLVLIPQLLLYAGLPLWVLSRIRLQSRSIGRALLVRAGWLALALVVAGGAIFASFQDIASLMRNNRELRFLVTPANYIYSLTQVAQPGQGGHRVREPVGADAVPGAGWAGRQKPVVMVMVLGETARAANWGCPAMPGRRRRNWPPRPASSISPT